MAQDQAIQQRFLAGWSTTLNTNLMFATRARRGVENARLGLDATKSKQKGGKGGEEEMPISDELRAEIERKEDDFVNVTEEAVGVMKNVSVFDSFCKISYREKRLIRIICCRSSIPLSPSATSQTSLPLSSNTIRRLMRS